ncbi:hypothetical protein H5P28_00845 [Ruficoccus amylovorans]|uniref:Uncharacterized protein n=1 Tax=Ruficoccus amylovorans TaxID=1804625 RepID=A0A842H9L4_9BACT|nr:hypothetical protein [Ruficoccus amylovorans]MBC2592798.1 hypothetical protein [Ruficoccus amylovorans]
MGPSLAKYPHLEFRRDTISRRAKQTKGIIGELQLIAKHTDGEHALYRNDKTSEYWQLASAWNWGALSYCFLVPEISLADWNSERYIDPDELIVFVGAVQNYFTQDSNRKIRGLKEHMEKLQKAGLFPKEPTGRWFGPYVRENVIPDYNALESRWNA